MNTGNDSGYSELAMDIHLSLVLPFTKASAERPPGLILARILVPKF